MSSMLRIGFVGLGSIAKRHIKNLARVLSKRGFSFEIDVFRHGYSRDKAGIEEISHVYSTEQIDATLEYDIFFITNPTALHFETIKKLVPHAKHMFIEKPVFDRCDVCIEELGLKSDSVYYIASPLRYTNTIQFVADNISLDEVYSARSICSSYLPDWRPGIDYRETYSSRKALGGGVEIDLIHEWDYLTFLFGMPENVLYAGGRFSDLEIDSDDLAAYIGIYSDKMIELHLDYFGRKNVRECFLFTRNDTIKVDIANSSIEYLNSGRIIDLSEDRNAYQIRELEHFLDIIDGKSINDNSIEHALKVLKIARNIK